jgi:hypothetical protein
MESKFKICGRKVKLHGLFGELKNSIYEIKGKYYIDEQGLRQDRFIGIYTICNTLVLYSEHCSAKFDIRNTDSGIDRLECRNQYNHEKEYGNDLLNSLAVIIKHCDTYDGVFTRDNIINVDAVSGRAYDGWLYTFMYRPKEVDKKPALYLYCFNTLYKRMDSNMEGGFRVLCIGKPIRECDKWVLIDSRNGIILMRGDEEIRFVGMDDENGVILCDGIIYDIEERVSNDTTEFVLKQRGKCL